MKRLQGIFAGSRIIALLLVVIAAGCEQILNHYFPFALGTKLLRFSIIILAALFLRYFWDGRVPVRSRCWAFAGFLMLVVLPVIYVLNASHEWRPGVGLLPIAHRDFLPATAYSRESIVSIWLGLGFASVIGSSVLLRTRQREIVLGCMVAVGFTLAVWVLCQRAIPRRYPIYEWTGWFISRNHYAAFACLLFPVAFTSGIRIQRRAFYAGKLSSPAVLYYLAAAVLAFSVVESRSRAGMGILLVQSLGLIIGYGYHQELIGLRFRRGFVVGAAIVLMGMVWVMGQRGNWSQVGDHLAFRGWIARDTISMWRDNPWWGTGPRSYAAVFPYYQSETLQGYYFHYAHNDPLQMLAEWGVLGVAILFFGVYMLFQARHDSPQHVPVGFGCFRMECFGLNLALGGVLIHSLVDFPFQHTHILLLAAVWGGMLGRLCSSSPATAVDSSETMDDAEA